MQYGNSRKKSGQVDHMNVPIVGCLLTSTKGSMERVSMQGCQAKRKEKIAAQIQFEAGREGYEPKSLVSCLLITCLKLLMRYSCTP